jgi:eukaryotic-like serine/threonine-protein kinase
MTPSLHPLDNKLLLGRYRVVRLLGEGGMGTVHLARVEGAEGFTRPVVVKRMKRDLRVTEEGNRLFIREAKILSKLQHPGIVGISDFGIDDGAPTMVLEYVHGYTLSPWLTYRVERKLPFPVDVCVLVVRRILDALYYAHRFNTEEGNELEIVHRDISPDNVLVSNRGYVHLLDFGIASIRGPQSQLSTKTGGFRGKLCYSAPETVMGQAATPRSDQYSAAVVLLEMLTGVTPFEADSVAETFMKMVSEAPPLASSKRQDVPPGLDAALMRALSKDPLQRFDSALSFSKELRRFQQLDDDDVLDQLRDMVQKDFDAMPHVVHVESLRDRQAALEKLLSFSPGPITVPGVVEDEELPTRLSHSTTVQMPRGNRDSRRSVAAGSNKQIAGLLWGLLIVGGLIALGLGATVATLSRNRGSSEQVVVIGGGREESGALGASVPTADERPEHTASSSPPSVASERVFSVVLQAPTSGGMTVSSQHPPSVNVKPAAGAPGQGELAASVQRKSGSFQSCFVQQLGEASAPADAVLHFEVAKGGTIAQVRVEPKQVSASALGSCLVAAANQVQFPALPEPVSFRVPVRARVSRGGEK